MTNQTGSRKLIHGTINHGTQLTGSRRRARTPTSYYGPKSGLGRAIRYFEAAAAVRVGIDRAGCGRDGRYGRAGDFFRFYEINPLDLSIATTWFTFLSDCPARSSGAARRRALDAGTPAQPAIRRDRAWTPSPATRFRCTC